MAKSVSFTWLQLFAAIGLGSIVASLISYWGSRAVAIANHRQNWINALRDDLANFLKEVDVMHFRIAMLLRLGQQDDLEKQQDCRNSAMLAYRRVLMRLNMTEALHASLIDSLNDLMTIDSPAADPTKMSAAVRASSDVLKYEWAVAKYGIFRRPAAALKAWWRVLFPLDQ